ncbi:hypothetical protein ASPACDRAFT_55655 [Aspergillus aculeatus ATCC 16872]|uniref:Uncharacterized protein n=1 Tax=Aspergillus aculeatus (strain ATCC 16872 / CBS 172.66 / WB 5094) TaxID=690307 RepID=A0A1L9WF05_ASPA1|nr:uncharacterized protein ASPACDRAFT_55655 [Aspergillus aculeatus ATCC 16872]OJJ94751.1 hypothetical protein ASPACDRAFT_55655 [Aspergillus aculeatus ATCC 16872]
MALFGDSESKKEKKAAKKAEKEAKQARKETDSFRGSFYVPDSASNWQKLATSSGLLQKSLYDLVNLGSGSRVKKKQFVLFKAFWPPSEPVWKLSDDAAEYELDPVWKEAIDLVNGSSEIGKYLQLVGQPYQLAALNENDDLWPGSWAPVLKWQNRCIALANKKKPAQDTPSTGTRSRKKQKTSHQAEKRPSDEAITNTTLLLFLDALSSLIPNPSFEFKIFRAAFEATFRTVSYRALTDGALWLVDQPEDIRVILEVKKMSRHDNADRIRMQETAEIVAWLKSSKPWQDCFGGHKILIAEDAAQVWVICAKPSSAYAAYLAQGTDDQNPFIEMKSYGPFLLNNSNEMRDLCIVVVAIMLRFFYSLQVH